MNEPSTSRKTGTKWIWIAVLSGLLIMVIVWFTDPLGSLDGAPVAEPAADPTEWAPAPTGPAVDVNLPETPLKNSPEQPDTGSQK